MSFIDKIDPEVVHAIYEHPPERYIAIGDDPPLAREMTLESNLEMRAGLPPTDVTIEELTIPGQDCDVPLAIYQPPGPAPRGGLLWLHGGGYIVGLARDDARCIEIAEVVGCTVVSVDYRLAPEATYRESIADSFAALNWMVEKCRRFGNRYGARRHRRRERGRRPERRSGALQPRPQGAGARLPDVDLSHDRRHA